jgi:hypothetical protein
MSMGRMMASETRLVKRMGLRPHVIPISGSASGGNSTSIIGGDGNEYIVGGAGSDSIWGGAGDVIILLVRERR